jgi:hypothetical protein
MVVLPDWASPEEFHSNLSGGSEWSPLVSTGDSPIDVFSFCTLLQMNISAAITSNLEERSKYLCTPSLLPLFII